MRLGFTKLILFCKTKKEKFQTNWKQHVTPKINWLGLFLEDILIKYDGPKFFKTTVRYIFTFRKFTFWFVVVSIAVGFIFSWQWTYIIYFTAYFYLKF
jgi:sensor histidine kinase YesM